MFHNDFKSCDISFHYVSRQQMFLELQYVDWLSSCRPVSWYQQYEGLSSLITGQRHHWQRKTFYSRTGF